MANLLSWNGLSLGRKKRNDISSGSTLLNSLQDPLKASINRQNQARANTATNNQGGGNGGASRNFGSVLNNMMSGNFGNWQQDEQQRQQAEAQRRQQEEEQRRQRIEQMRQEQEKRQQEEQARRVQQQQAQQQKQQSLLSSSLGGGRLLDKLGSQNNGLNNANKNLPNINSKLQGSLIPTSSSNIGQKTEAPKPMQPVNNENSWKRYYEEERQKVRNDAFKNDGFGSWTQDVFNAGWDRRLAEQRAKDRYANELIRKAWDDNGNVVDSNAVEQARKAVDDSVNTSRQYGEQERAKSRALGASYDSDYKDNPFLATFNAVRNMDVGNAIFGDDDPEKADLSDVGRFIANLLPGMASAPITGMINATEAVAGKGLDKETGNLKKLDNAERTGRALSGAIDLAGPFIGGSGKLLSSVGKTIFNKGASELTKQAIKGTTKDVIKGYLNSMLQEGAEEGIQQAFEFFGDGGKLITKDGEFDADSFKQMLAESGQAAALGAVGGGMFHAGAKGLDAANSAIRNRSGGGIDLNSNINNNLISNNTAESENTVTPAPSEPVNTQPTNITPEQVQTTNDGSMVKTNPDGTNSKLSDAELASVIEQSGNEQNATQSTTATGMNPFQNNALNLKSSTENIETLRKQALQGNTYAQQRLAKLTNQNQEENTDWRGKNVQEVINPEENNNPIAQNPQNEANINEQINGNQAESQNTLQNASNELEGKAFDELTPAEQAKWLELHDSQVMSKTQLAQALRQMNIDPTGMSRLDMLRKYNKALNNTAPQITPSSEIGNTPEVLPNERAIAQSEDEKQKTMLQQLSELWGGEPTETITNEPKYNEAEAAQKAEDVLEGKTSFEDYLGDQRELLWKSFKESNRGVERGLKADPVTEQIEGRWAMSNNGTLYRDLFKEAGNRKPTKAEFNEALDDVLKNGENSRYYDGFRELNHSGDRAFGYNQGNEDIEVILALKEDAPVKSNQSVLTQAIKNAENNTPTFKENINTLAKTLTGQNQLQPAYAGVDNNSITKSKGSDEQNVDLNKNYTIIKGGAPDGSNLVKTDYNLPKNATIRDVSAAIRSTIRERFLGNSYKIGDTNSNAEITRRTKSEMGYKQSNMSEADFIKKGSMIGNLDELIENMTNARSVPNRKPDTKPNIDHYISGRVAVDLGDGKIYYPRIDIEINKSGRTIGYDIADIKEFPTYHSDDQPRAREMGTHGRNYSVSQNGENVNGKKSSFSENTSTNRNFSQETRSELKSDPLTYKPTTNEERLSRANEVLSTKSTDEIDNYLRDNFFNVKDKDRNSGDMVLAGEFAKQLDAKGQYDRSTEIINKMSEIGTKQGQNIQAMSLMMNRSPEGIANMAQTAIKKSGGEMNGELRQQIVEKTREIGRVRADRAKLEEENATISKQIMEGKGDLKALRKRQMEIAQKYRMGLDKEGRQFSQLADTVDKNSPDKRSIFGAVWRAGLLSGPRTHTGNALSNTFQNMLNAGSDRIAAGLDWARAKATGTERQVVSNAGGRGKGLKRGLKAAKEVMTTGNNLWTGADAVSGNSNIWGRGGELEFKNKIANNMVAKPSNFVFRAMSAGDLPFRYAAFENAIRTEAKRQGMNQGYKGQALQDYIESRVATPDPELQAYGIRKGNEAVYDVDTKLSSIMNRVDKFIDSQDNKVVKSGMRGAKTLIAPFVKVPSKVLSTAIDYSPLGTVKAIVNKVGSKNYTTAQFETDLARSGLGTAGFVGLGYALSAAGLLTGGYPDSSDERNRWKAEGIEPNSIKIGDTYLSLNYLGPASMLMSMGSGVQQRQANGEDPLSIVGGTLTDTLNTFLDQSYVQGLSNTLNAITDSSRYGENYINSFARGLVPNLLRQTATATDPMQRQVNDAGEAVVSGIPGASQALDAKVDTYGQEIGNKQTLPLGQMWDALKLSNARETNEVIDEVNRLHSVDPNNKDLQITPPQEDNTLSVDGVNVKITDKQKTQLQKDTGEAAVTAMRSVMNSDKYASLSDTEKAKALDKARSEAQSQARKQFIKANNITADNNPETRNSGGKVDNDYSSKAIGSATSSGKSSTITAHDSLSQENKSIIDKYNSMSSDDWKKYLYGDSADSASAEYRLAKAKYENDLANGDVTDTQKIKKEKELRKLEVGQEWTKNYRDAYSLAGSKADMQAYLNELDDSKRSETVGILNGLNRAMYEAGVIKASTYKARANAINGTTTASKSKGRKKSSKGRSSGGSKSKSSDGMTSAEASALASLAKTMAKGSDSTEVKTPKAPNTKRKLTKSSGKAKQTALATYSGTPKKITVTKGTNKRVS